VRFLYVRFVKSKENSIISCGGKTQASVKPLVITATVLVPVLAAGTGLIIWVANRGKNEDDKKNNQKPDDKSKNQEGFVPEVNRLLDSMNLKDWKVRFNNAIDKIKKYTPNVYDKGYFEDSFNIFYEIINGRKIEKEKIKVESNGDHICVYAHINESLYYKLVLRETEFIVQKWGNSSKTSSLPEFGWGNIY